MRKYLIFFVISFFSLSLSAQDSIKKYSISIMPQVLSVNGFRMDYERYLTPKIGIYIAPQIYLIHKNNDYPDLNDPNAYYDDYFQSNYDYNMYDDLIGVGIEVGQKLFFYESESSSNYYFGYGLSYQYFKLNYKKPGWQSYTEEEMEKWELTYLDVEENISKIGGNVMIGLEQPIYDFLLLDIYVGIGIRYSSFKNMKPEESNFNDGFIEFGYTGTLPVMGIKLGFLF